MRSPSFGDKRVLVGGLPHLPLGDEEGPCDRFLIRADKKISGWLKVIFLVWGGAGGRVLSLQLGYVLSLGLLTWPR